MRVIAGEKRSLKLVAPEGLDTRPTTDRIKETLFNILQSDVPGCYFLDLYAGSGQMGIEALSRGANYCVFVENAKSPIECIEKNIKTCGYEKKSQIIKMDVLSALHSLEGRYRFGVIFMDPPYAKGLEKDILKYLSDSSLCDEDTIIIVEADDHTDFSYAQDIGLSLYRVKKYKTNMHAFMRINK
ncbi:MAG: 16S rRNA (guanine(966)-N(2))-methyltransferase RsmD [Lachnospiraceae bacterium]|nr:16S rRNA (guanine(966)-N(2))-methyltransferase RsmD [Lachnospiraceae bacterium]